MTPEGGVGARVRVWDDKDATMGQQTSKGPTPAQLQLQHIAEQRRQEAKMRLGSFKRRGRTLIFFLEFVSLVLYYNKSYFFPNFYVLVTLRVYFVTL